MGRLINIACLLPIIIGEVIAAFAIPALLYSALWLPELMKADTETHYEASE